MLEGGGVGVDRIGIEIYTKKTEKMGSRAASFCSLSLHR
jgi:hypothetical protein